MRELCEFCGIRKDDTDLIKKILLERPPAAFYICRCHLNLDVVKPLESFETYD